MTNIWIPSEPVSNDNGENIVWDIWTWVAKFVGSIISSESIRDWIEKCSFLSSEQKSSIKVGEDFIQIGVLKISKNTTFWDRFDLKDGNALTFDDWEKICIFLWFKLNKIADFKQHSFSLVTWLGWTKAKNFKEFLSVLGFWSNCFITREWYFITINTPWTFDKYSTTHTDYSLEIGSPLSVWYTSIALVHW